eukprot:gene61862-biopygen30735
MNRFVQHCKIIGDAVNIINDQNYPEKEYEPAVQAFTPEVIAQINSASNTPHLLDVASVTDDSIIERNDGEAESAKDETEAANVLTPDQPEWPEIKDRHFYDQTAFDRPDVTTQVFKARLTAFLHNLRN